MLLLAYKLLLKYEREEVKGRIIERDKNLGYNIHMDQRENVVERVEIYNNAIVLSIIFRTWCIIGTSHWKNCLEYIKALQTYAGNVINKKGHFAMLRECVKKPENVGTQWHTITQKVLKMHIQFKPEIFLLGLMAKQLEKNYETLFLCMMFQRNYYIYKNEKIVKIMELAEIAPLTPSIGDMTLFKFNENW